MSNETRVTTIIAPLGAATKQKPPYTCDVKLDYGDFEDPERCGKPAAYLARRRSGEALFFICEDDNHWTCWPLDLQEDLVPGVAVIPDTGGIK